MLSIQRIKNISDLQLPVNSNKFSKNIFWVYSIIIQNKKFNAIKLSKNLKKRY